MTAAKRIDADRAEFSSAGVPHCGTEQRLPAGWLLVLFLGALLLRGGYGAYQLAASGAAELTFPDEQQYWLMSRQLRAGEPLADELGFHATRMPLYPGWLAMFPDSPAGLIGARAIQWIIGALVAPLVALLGARAVDGRVGLAAGVMAAADPSLVGVSSLLLTEAVFVTVLAAWWWVSWPLVRSNSSGGFRQSAALGGAKAGSPGTSLLCWVWSGALAGLCVYLRPSSAGLVAAWAVLLAVRQGLGRGRTWVGAAAGLAIVVLSLVPWAARNYRITGHWCWLTTRGGISLYDGVGPQATGASDLAAIKNMPGVAGLDEAAWDRWFSQASWDAIRSDPWRMVRLAGVKLARTWSPFLHAEELSSPGIRAVFAVWWIGLYGLAIAGAARLRDRPVVVVGLLMPALYLAALHSVYVGSVRYRVGAVPALAVLAGVGIVGLVRRRVLSAEC